MPKAAAKSAPSLVAQISAISEQLDAALLELAQLQLYAQAQAALQLKLADAIEKRDGRVDAILDGAGEGGLSAAALKRLRAAQVSASAQLLKLQMAMQRENQVFTAISNVMKTRHDTVKNAIGNVR